MRTSLSPITRTIALVLAAGVGSQALAQNAAGQPTIVRRAAPSRGVPSALPTVPSPTAPLSKERLQRYAKALELDADQTTAAEALYDAYVATTQRQQKALRDKIEESGDGGIITTADGAGKIGEVMKKHAAASRQTRDQYLSDLKSILRPEQAGNWSTLERLRRRDNYLSRGSLSGSTIDLITLVDAIKLSDAQRAPLKEALQQYEMNIDRPLQLREQFFESEQSQGVQSFTPESLKTRQDRQREIDAKVKDVNLAAARQLAELVPADQRATFDDLVKRETYRSVYKEPSAVRKLQAAQQLKSLSQAQREKLAAALDRYQREAPSANQRWAEAIAKAEAAGLPTGSGPGMMMGGKLDPELSDARKARRELDNSLKEAVKSTLNPDQISELPTPNNVVTGRTVSVTSVADGSTGQHMAFMSSDDLDDDDIGAISGGAPAVIIMRSEHSTGPDGQPASPPPPSEQPQSGTPASPPKP